MGASLRKIELPKSRLKPGVRVRICSPLREQIGLLTALRSHQRVLVLLLQLLGGERRVELARNAIEAIE